MRSVSKMVTNPNGHTSSAMGSMFFLAGIVAIVAFIVSLF